MKRPIAEFWPAALFLCGFAAYLALGIAHHEAWRDEWQAINIARAATSLPDLYHRLRYEGHPALWYLVARGAWEIHPSLLSVQLLNAAFVLTAASLVAFFAPWPVWLRLLAAAAGPAAFEYSIKARSYGLGWFLIVALAVTLQRPAERWKPWAVALLAALALNTSVFTGIVAFALVLGWLWQEYRAGRLRRLYLPVSLLAGVSVLTFLLALPPADVSMGNLTEARVITPQFLLALPGLFVEAVLPQTRLDTLHVSLVLPAALGFVYLCTRHLLAGPAARIALLSGWLCLMLFFLLRIVPIPYPWHLWHLYLMPVAAAMAFGTKSETKPAALAVLAVLALLGLGSGIKMYARDWKEPYSGAQPAAQAIKSAHLDHLPVVITTPPFLSSLSGYLGNPVYDGYCREELSYHVWRKEAVSPDAFACAYTLAQGSPQRESLFIHVKPIPEQVVPTLVARYNIRIQFLGAFLTGLSDEDMYVYLIQKL